MNIPPTAPAIPPKPTTDPTACLGNMSDASVNAFADQPWCAAVARLMIATAPQTPWTCVVKTIGTTPIAQTSIAVLRAALTVHPRLMSVDDSHPPPTLPT